MRLSPLESRRDENWMPRIVYIFTYLDDYEVPDPIGIDPAYILDNLGPEPGPGIRDPRPTAR